MNWIPYHCVITALWIIACGAIFWYFRSRRKHGPLLKRLSWPNRIFLIAAFVVTPVSYVYSYPLYQRVAAALPKQRSWLVPLDDLYIPAQFLHQHWVAVYPTQDDKLGPVSELYKPSQLPDNSFESYEPYLYPLALAAVILIPYVIHRIFGLKDFHNETKKESADEH